MHQRKGARNLPRDTAHGISNQPAEWGDGLAERSAKEQLHCRDRPGRRWRTGRGGKKVSAILASRHERPRVRALHARRDGSGPRRVAAWHESDVIRLGPSHEYRGNAVAKRHEKHGGKGAHQSNERHPFASDTASRADPHVDGVAQRPPRANVAGRPFGQKRPRRRRAGATGAFGRCRCSSARPARTSSGRLPPPSWS